MTKIIISVATGLILATISAAAKSFIDVEKLKLEVNHVHTAIMEIKEDVKEVKRILLYKRSQDEKR